MYIMINTKSNIGELPNIVRLENNWKIIFMLSKVRLEIFFRKNNLKLYNGASKSGSQG